MSNAQRKTQQQHQISEADLEMVKRIARYLLKTLPSCVRFDDLYQSGVVGLLEAVQKFDASRDIHFSTYASIRVRGAMIDELRRGDWAPRSVYRNARLLSEAEQAIEHREGRPASDREIADSLEMDMSDYYRMKKDKHYAKVSDLEEMDFMPAYAWGHHDPALSNVIQSDFERRLQKNMAHLTMREQEVIRLYYQADKNLRQIGELLGVTESRVSQIHSQAIQTLNRSMRDTLESFGE